MSFYDQDGAWLSPRRFARMFAHHKYTLKASLTVEMMSALRERLALRVITLADDALDNCSSLEELLPVGESLVDFYHVTEHLHEALGAAYGETRGTYQVQCEKLRQLLRDAPEGLNKLIRSLRYM
jgi:hypothetical protein